MSLTSFYPALPGLTLSFTRLYSAGFTQLFLELYSELIHELDPRALTTSLANELYQQTFPELYPGFPVVPWIYCFLNSF